MASFTVDVAPSVLVWARTSAGLSVGAVAKRMGKRGPALALMSDVLTLVLADAAERRWRGRRHVLGAAGDADMVVHRSPSLVASA